MKYFIKIFVVGLFALLFLGCYFTTPSPKGHEYKLIKTDSEKFVDARLNIFSTPSKKRVFFESKQNIEHIEICSNFTYNNAKCHKMFKDELFADHMYSTIWKVRDNKFYKNYKKDTLVVSIKKNDTLLKLTFISIEND